MSDTYLDSSSSRPRCRASSFPPVPPLSGFTLPPQLKTSDDPLQQYATFQVDPDTSDGDEDRDKNDCCPFSQQPRGITDLGALEYPGRDSKANGWNSGENIQPWRHFGSLRNQKRGLFPNGHIEHHVERRRGLESTYDWRAKSTARERGIKTREGVTR